MKALILFITASCLLTIGCSESKQDYTKRVTAFVDSVMAEANPNLHVAATRVRVWSNAIFDNHMSDPMTGEPTSDYVFDFNKALAAYNESELIVMVKQNRDKGQIKLDSLFQSIKVAPDDATNIFTSAKEIYLLYKKTYKIAFDVKGSLQSYREEVTATRSKLDELVEKFKLETI